jgi:histone deacetylase 1/2
MILEHLSKLEHVPSVQFHDRPSDPEGPEEVLLFPLLLPAFDSLSCFLMCVHFDNLIMQMEEDMDKRPAQRSRLWSGGAYDSDTEDPENMKSKTNELTAKSILKVCPSAPKHLCHSSCLRYF